MKFIENYTIVLRISKENELQLYFFTKLKLVFYYDFIVKKKK